jgi:hypothetical protein
MNLPKPNPPRSPVVTRFLIGAAPLLLAGCRHHPVVVVPADPSATVIELPQQVPDDPAVTGGAPQGWLLPDAGAGLDLPDPTDLELQEFEELFERTRAPRVVEEELLPGATRTVALEIAGPAGLGGTIGWIGTVRPLAATIALDGTALVTGTPYRLGSDRGGAYLAAQTTAGGRATLSVTNTAGVRVKVRLVFVARDL